MVMAKVRQRASEDVGSPQLRRGIWLVNAGNGEPITSMSGDRNTCNDERMSPFHISNVALGTGLADGPLHGGAPIPNVQRMIIPG